MIEVIVPCQRIYLPLSKDGIIPITIQSPPSGPKVITSKNESTLISSNIKLNSINPWFITGFTDGDGSFSIKVSKSKSHSIGYKVELVYSINNLNTPENNLLLKNILKTLGIEGNVISIRNNRICQFTITKMSQLEIIRRHFVQYPLQSTKRFHFEQWCIVMDLIKNKSH